MDCPGIPSSSCRGTLLHWSSRSTRYCHCGRRKLRVPRRRLAARGRSPHGPVQRHRRREPSSVTQPHLCRPELELVVVDEEPVAAGAEIHHQRLVEHVVGVRLVVPHILRNRRPATTNAVAGPVSDNALPAAERYAAASVVALGVNEGGEGVASDGGEGVADGEPVGVAGAGCEVVGLLVDDVAGGVVALPARFELDGDLRRVEGDGVNLCRMDKGRRCCRTSPGNQATS